MAIVLEGITAVDVRAAVEDFDAGAEHGFGPSTKFDLVIEGRTYPPKAILGLAARRLGRPLTPGDFSGGDKRSNALLRRLGFEVRERAPSGPEALVLVDAERTAGGLHDDWADVTGQLYHFPNQYKNRVRPGVPFVYYRGVRRAQGQRATPEYFGAARIAEVWRDDAISESAPKKDWKWYAKIVDYVPFTTPVPWKLPDGSNREGIEDANLWGVGVRPLTADQYRAILEAAGETPPAIDEGDEAATTPPPKFPDIERIEESTGLLVPRTASSGERRSEANASARARRSRTSKAIGDRGEQTVLKRLRETLTPDERETLRWVAGAGETPGWDIEYTDKAGQLIRIEVKATTSTRFPSFELTAQEWAAAETHRGRYWVYLVADCRSTAPKVEKINDPFGMMSKGQLAATPSAWLITATPAKK